MKYEMKEVYFGEYCPKCEYEKLEETESPCDECMAEPANWCTHKPVRYEERKNNNGRKKTN